MTVEEIIQADKDGERFRVECYPGIAFHFHAIEERDEYDPETGENISDWTGYRIPTGNVLMVMVGDDRSHVVDPSEVSVISEYCPECGQIGCKAYQLS